MKFGKSFTLIGLLSFLCGSFGSQIEYELLQKLFTNYSTDNRPVRFPNESLTVVMDLALNQIIDLNEASETLEVKTWLRLTWTDYHLQWTPAEHGDIKTIIVAPSKVWKPDIILYDDVTLASPINDYREDFGASISSNGTIKWNVPYVYLTSCNLNIRYFPYDKQTCLLKLGSWSYTKDKLDLKNKSASADLKNYQCDGQWDLLGVTVVRNAVGYFDSSIYVDLTYTMKILRKPWFHVFNIIFPCLLLTATAMLMFLLPPESGEKLSLGVTVLLAQTVFLLIVAQTVPATDTTPLASQCLSAAITLLGVSTALTIFTLHLHHRGVLAVGLPKPLRIVFLEFLANIFFMRKYIKANNAAKRELEMRMSNVQTAPKYKKLTPRNEQKDIDGNLSPHNLDGNGFENVTSQYNTLMALNSHLVEIVEILQDFQQSSINDDEQKDTVAEWTLFAMVIDRLLFVVFAIATTITISLILSSHPTYSSEVPQPCI